MKKYVIAADLGRVRLFCLERDPLEEEGRWRASELETPPLKQTPKKIQDEVSDQAGEFARGSVAGEPGGMSYGEEHNYKTEHEKKLIRGLARHIGEILEREKPEVWNLAAPQPILKRLESALDAEIQERLKEALGLDLTKATLKEIEERFAPLIAS